MASRANWKQIDYIVHAVSQLLRYRYTAVVTKYLDWYEILDKKKSYTDAQFKLWLRAGVPYTKNMVNALDAEIKQIDKLQTSAMTKVQSASQRYQVATKYEKQLLEINQILVDFLGCRGKFNSWYVGFLRQYASDPAVKSNLDYFEQTCLKARSKLLTKRTFV